MIKVLFLIHDLGQGGAEKVLVNLVNNLDRSRFDISVISLFGGGVNEQFLKKDIHYRTVCSKEIPGNSKWMKLFSPKQLHSMCIKEHYDIEISYLEGPSARIISGCPDENTKLVSWIHVEQHTKEKLAASFRNFTEAVNCYNKFEQIACVSQFVKKDFCKILNFKRNCDVLYNTIESEMIRCQSRENVEELSEDGRIRLIAVGTLKESKGYDRLLRIIKRLNGEHYPIHLYILGIGPQQTDLEQYVKKHRLNDVVSFLGYQTNPYKYVARCDLFVCASHAEGFSTAATEALILGVPVCTVEVSGMKEMLGEHNEFGIVTENSEEALYEGIKGFITKPQMLLEYKMKAQERGKSFSTENTVREVEKMLLSLEMI